MKKPGSNVHLKPYDDIFSTDQSRFDPQKEKVQDIPLSKLRPFKDHPFQVIDDEHMQKMVDSVQAFGVLSPAIARPLSDGSYELISGHRRYRASELAGKDSLPVIVRELDDDAAIILMVDANLQRETILPSERAFAYRMKMNALKHQGKRLEATSRQFVDKMNTADWVGAINGESGRQVQRYIRLTELIPELLEFVDAGKMKLNPAVEISHLTKDEQHELLVAISHAQAMPSLSQAKRIKKMAFEDECTSLSIYEILCENISPKDSAVTLSKSVLKKFFPDSFSNTQIEEIILQLLAHWKSSNCSH